MKHTMELTQHDMESLRCIAQALHLDLNTRGVKAQIIRTALHFTAARFDTPCCPDCGTDLVPILDEDGTPTGRWYCPGCVE